MTPIAVMSLEHSTAVGRLLKLVQFHQRPHPAFHPVIAHHDQFRRKSDFRHRQFESLSPRQRRLQMQRPSNEGDARVPERRQMLHRLPDSVLIVDADVGDSRYVRSHVHEYQRNFAKTKVFNDASLPCQTSGSRLHPRGARSCAAPKIPSVWDHVRWR